MSATKRKPAGERRTVHDVVVVGGGMAGLTASAFAAKAGCRVLLCEKQPVFGGLVNSFERDGFTWDVGVRALENSGIILPMLEALEISIPFVKSPVSLGIEDHVIPVETPGNLADYQALLEHFYPESREDIAKILAVVKRVMKQMAVLYGVENPTFKDLKRDRAYLFQSLLPWLGRFLLTIGKINRMDMPVDEYLKALSSNQSLIDIISQHFFKKTPAFFALSYFSLYLDYLYPVGGTGTLSRALETDCASRGVDLRSETPIVSVDPVAHTVMDPEGTIYEYRQLVWAADLRTFYQSLDIDALPRKKTRRAVRERATLTERARGGDSVFTLYLGVDREPAWFEARSHGHLFYTPKRHGVGQGIYEDLDGILSDARSGDESRFRTRAEQWIQHYISSTTFEISIPVLKDSSMAPPGKTGLIVSVLFDYDLCAAAREHGWYEELRAWTEDCLLESLEASIYPGLRSVVIDRFSSTPVTIETVNGSSEGAITGWAFTNPVMPAVQRIQSVARSVRTFLPDISQAGQWSYSPSGVPIAILTGKLAADRVARNIKKRRR